MRFSVAELKRRRGLDCFKLEEDVEEDPCSPLCNLSASGKSHGRTYAHTRTQACKVHAHEKKRCERER